MREVMSVSLPAKLASELSKYKRQSGRNKSDIVKDALSVYLWEARLRATRSALRTRAKRAGCVTEDDVLRLDS